MLKNIAYRILLGAVCALLLVPAAWAEESDTQPAQVVSGFNDVLLKSMRQGQKLGFQGRFQLIRPAYEAGFAWQSMARFAAGKFWGSMSPDERKTYLDAYRDWSVATYADRFHTHKGQTFAVVPQQQDDRRAEVLSRLTKADGDTVELNYKLRKSSHGWQVVDIQVRGVSQLALTRTQFLAVLDNQGLPALIAHLQKKTVEMAADVSP